MKKCPVCGEEKAESAFHVDKSRPDDRKWLCIECARKKRQEGRDDALREAMPTAAEFQELSIENNLSSYIEKQAHRYARKDVEFRNDLMQEAWLAAASSTGDDPEIVKHAAHKAIERVYRRAYEYRKYHEIHADMTQLDEILEKQKRHETPSRPSSDKAFEGAARKMKKRHLKEFYGLDKRGG